MRFILTLGAVVGIISSLSAQNNDEIPPLGFFNDYWQPAYAITPDHMEISNTHPIPEVIVQLNPADTLVKVSPFIGGYNLNTFFGGKIYDKPELLEHIRNLKMPFFRFPGGSGSDFYFWNAVKPDKPDDVDTWLVKGIEKTNIKWGDEPGEDYLSIDNYYRLRDSTFNQGINVVNYAYARYGLTAEPVQYAAHLAAEWVRYDRGRTLFWEIGNENYGAWEAGYEIDTSKNLDDQPRYLTGKLYAAHCEIFLDSMRAAASEIGTEIRIGAVIGFKTRYDVWNRAVIGGLGNKVDFYSLHKYYGNRNDAGANEILNAISEFYSDKIYIDALINQYCDPFVPLVKTEWNTRYDGRNQNVSCANGLFTMLGLKGIIHTGIGLSSKWNLIWGYQDGETHGLITNAKDNPEVEGLPSFTPRAPFFYNYYFKKVLGDVAVNSSVSSGNNLDIFSSAFSSGHLGVVVVNKSDRSIATRLDIVNFNKGDNHYWYTLSPTANDPLSREVMINGFENEEYDAGGPANYDTIKAFSSPSEEGILLTLLPYSATFLLAEGNTEVDSSWVGIKESPTKGHQTGFNLYPNPTGAHITAKHSLPMDRLEIIDISGKTVLLNETISSTEVQIDLAHIPGGIYFVKIKDRQQREIIERLVIQHQ